MERVFITKVKYKDPAVIVFWSDDTKTTASAKVHKGEKFDREKGLLICVMKKLIGSDFNETLKMYAGTGEDEVIENPYLAAIDKVSQALASNIADMGKLQRGLMRYGSFEVDNSYDSIDKAANYENVKSISDRSVPAVSREVMDSLCSNVTSEEAVTNEKAPNIVEESQAKEQEKTYNTAASDDIEKADTNSKTNESSEENKADESDKSNSEEYKADENDKSNSEESNDNHDE